MEYHMAHESIPIAQERQMVKHIKKLRDSRQRVRQYEELYADVETARAAVHSGRGELKEMLEERQVYLACWSCLLIQLLYSILPQYLYRGTLISPQLDGPQQCFYTVPAHIQGSNVRVDFSLVCSKGST